MSGAVLARAAIAPVFADATLRAEQVSQLVLGETADVLEVSGVWRKVRTELDRYVGWVHVGYCTETDDASADLWRQDAGAWSHGATARAGEERVRLPLRARVALEGAVIRLPDGRRAHVHEGRVATADEAVASARAQPPEHWALEHFAGSPYEWGGVTPYGVDCSGLVQTTFLARGLRLPRDASQQMDCGATVSLDQLLPGDLLFFRGETTHSITHVAFAGEADTLVHSAVAVGGVRKESWRPESRAAALRDRLVAVRRLEAR